jgi:hypothetical protein
MISPARVSRSQTELPARARSRRGLSVVELLAATVISLIVMGATVQLFGTVGNQISNGRSNIELGDRIRTAVERLRKDLRGHTADTLTWNRPEDASGYLEIVKGPAIYWDQNAWKQWVPMSGQNQTAPTSVSTAVTTAGSTLAGYTKDMLFFTSRSRDQPFVGRVVNASGQNMTVESQVAEVAWYLQPTNLGTPQNPVATTPPTYTLYRRQMLVLPGLATIGPNAIATGTPPSIPANRYYDSYSGSTSIPSGTVPLCDISAHPDGVNTWSPSTGLPNMILNSLADLSYRENRFAHFFAPASSSNNAYGNTAFGSGQPFPIYPSQVSPFPQSPAADPNLRYGEDVVLSNVLSFDIKVWDPWAQVKQDSKGNPLVPSDPGYSGGSTIGSGVYGAYVDLNWNNGAPVTNPSGVPAPYFAQGFYGLGSKSYLTPSPAPTNSSPIAPAPVSGCATYDTWSAGYETWLYNPTGSTPQTSNISNNGFDDMGSGVDSPNERLTCPPYPVPLRGVQIKIRTYEFTSKQVREVTLQESFVPD